MELDVVSGADVVTGMLVVAVPLSVLVVDAGADVVVASLVLVQAVDTTVKTMNNTNSLIREKTYMSVSKFHP